MKKDKNVITVITCHKVNEQSTETYYPQTIGHIVTYAATIWRVAYTLPPNIYHTPISKLLHKHAW